MPPTVRSGSPQNLENMSPNPIMMTKGNVVLQNMQYLLQKRVMQQVYGACKIPPASHRRSFEAAAGGCPNGNMSDDEVLSKISTKQII